MKDNTLRLNLVFSLLNIQSVLYSLVYVAVLVAAYFLLNTKSIWILLVFPVIFLVYKIIFATKTLKLERDTIRFTYTHHVHLFRRSVPVRVDYTVMNIRDLNFEQNAVEKLLGAGHISFTGRTFADTDSIYSNDIDIKTSFIFYGLTHFRQTKNEICNILGVNETE